jgi:hypothetical protein
LTVVRAIRAELADVLEDAFDADAVLLAAGIKIQVTSRMLINPTSYAVDIYPGSPFGDGSTAGFGGDSGQMDFTVRCRIGGDHDAYQDILDRMMSPDDELCVESILMADQSLNGLCSTVYCQPPSGYISFLDSGNQGQMPGVLWVLTVIPVFT